jgi:hypothetical protein
VIAFSDLGTLSHEETSASPPLTVAARSKVLGLETEPTAPVDVLTPPYCALSRNFLAAANKYLAKSNKSRTASRATKTRNALERDMKKVPNLLAVPDWSELTRKQKVTILLFVAAILVVGGELDRTFAPPVKQQTYYQSDLKPQNYCPPQLQLNRESHGSEELNVALARNLIAEATMKAGHTTPLSLTNAGAAAVRHVSPAPH